MHFFQYQSGGQTRFLNLADPQIKLIQFLHAKGAFKVTYHGLRRAVKIDSYPDVERLMMTLRSQGRPAVSLNQHQTPPQWVPLAEIQDVTNPAGTTVNEQHALPAPPAQPAPDRNQVPQQRRQAPAQQNPMPAFR